MLKPVECRLVLGRVVSVLFGHKRRGIVQGFAAAFLGRGTEAFNSGERASGSITRGLS
jgi:hypothetical protein